MPALFPIVAIVAVFVFISTHAAVSPSSKSPEEKKPSDDLAKAIEKMIKASADGHSSNGKS